MPHTIVNPAGLHDPTNLGYGHVAVTSGELVFIAGQYASDAEGNVSSQDFAEQVDLTVARLRTALESVGLDFEDVVQLRVHIVDHDLDKLGIVTAKLTGLRDAPYPAVTLTGVAALATPDMLIEIDAVATRR